MAIVTKTFVAAFTSGSVPATGLSPLPTITIRRVDTGAIVVNGASATEVGNGWYKYDYSSFDTSLGYVATWNGGTGLLVFERSFFGATEAEPVEAIAEDILDTDLGTHLTPGTAGFGIAMATHLQDAVWVDWPNGTDGTAWPLGTAEDPVRFLSDAKTIALARGLRKIVLRSENSVSWGPPSGGLRGFEIVGLSYGCTFNLGSPPGYGDPVSDCIFRNMEIKGKGPLPTVSSITVIDGQIRDLVDVNVHARRCGLVGTIVPPNSGFSVYHDCYLNADVARDTPVVFDMSNGQDVAIMGFNGNIVVDGMNSSSANFRFSGTGKVTLNANVTAGNVSLYGAVELNDLGAALTSFERRDIEEFVEARLATDHGAGQWDDVATQAEIQAAMTAQGYTPARALLLDNLDGPISGIVADVWSEVLGDSLTASEVVLLTLGLVQNNFKMDNTVYDANGLLTSARLRVWDTAANVGTGAGVLASWLITAVPGPQPGTAVSYQVVKQ